MADKTLIADWIRHAANDLISARHLFEDLHPKQTEIAAYLSQQCAEKSLKAFLVFNDTEPPRTHNLIKLCKLCKNIDGDFSTLETHCENLNPLGSEMRYPNELAPDDAIVKAAIETAQKIHDFCRAKVNLP